MKAVAAPRRAPARTEVPTWVFGAGGLLAGELLRLAVDHPHLTLHHAITRSGGEELGELHPQLPLSHRTVDAALGARELVDAARGTDGPLLCVLALPHGEAAATWSGLRAALGEHAGKVLVLDLSADYRLRDPEAWRARYGTPHADPDELAAFALGLPELFREPLGGATRIAAPGCFATAMQLATVPAARAAGLLDARAPWVHHAITGSSGSGRTPSATTHHPHRHANLWAYAPDGHRHEAELEQALAPTGLAPRVHLVPCSGPFVRGIHLTATLPLARDVDRAAILELYREAYEAAPFVDVLDGAPDLHRVVGSNRAALGVALRDGLLRVTVTLDNVLKGGAGQALQALNVARGWPETTGLPRTALGVL